MEDNVQRPLPEKPRKARRITQACDFCHKRSIKCSPSPEDAAKCQNCIDFGLTCSYDRPVKQRGVKHKAKNPSQSLVDAGSNGSVESRSPQGTDRQHSQESEWRPKCIGTHGMVTDLVDIYFEIVYPMFPLFHQPTMLRRLANREYLTNRALYSSTMAMCALASARTRDGALYSNRWNPKYYAEPASEVFAAAAEDAIPKDLTTVHNLDYLRACALLAIISIQYGQINGMLMHLGVYHTMTTVNGLYDEIHWPAGIGLVEIEERRRLFWSIYTLEIYSSVVWGCIMRCREAHAKVHYPTAADDETFSDEGFNLPCSPAAAITRSWMQGWNFTTDLYRILEHIIDRYRTRCLQDRPIYSVAKLFRDEAPPKEPVLETISGMFIHLPGEFKEMLPVSFDSKKDIYGFQAANITATFQLVKMLLFASEAETVERKCQAAGDLLAVFTNVPVAYLRAISSPLLHHLAGIGSILGSVVEGPLSENSYDRVRKILLAMADLITSLEAGLQSRSGASERLRSLVAKIDGFMQEQRKNEVAHRRRYVEETRMIQSSVSQPATYSQSGSDSTSSHDFMNEQLQYQIPVELLEEWPWAFNSTGPTDSMPLRFDWELSTFG